MLSRLNGRLNTRIYNWAIHHNPWTNVYGLARTFIALSTLMTLLFNDVTTLFKPMAGVDEYPACSVYAISIFCLVPNDYMYLNIVKAIAIIMLAIIASGWRPRYTGIVHWWIASSIHNTAATLDGGEQVAVAITLLLIPITLLDSRKWHWSFKKNVYKSEHAKIVALLFIYAIRIQVSIIYFHAAVAKVFNPEWIDGTAVYYYFNDPMLGVNSMLHTILSPLMTSSAVAFITWGTIVVEVVLAAGLFAQKNHWKMFLALGVSLHIGIAFVLGLYSFSLIMCAALLIAYRPSEQTFSFSFVRRTNDNLLTDSSLM